MDRESKTDEIIIENLECFAYHGVYDSERQKGQLFYINAVLFTDTAKAGRTDELADSTDYGALCGFIDDWMKKHTCSLLEAVAERLAQEILLNYPLIKEIDLEIRKPQAPIELPFGCVSVKIHRGWHQVYLSVGSNMGDRRVNIEGAVQKLSENRLIRQVVSSDLFVTKPYGGVEQEDFLNGAIGLWTLLSPGELLELLHEIEAAAGRERLVRWGPRTLDLDILFYDKLVYEDERLVIPHVDMENRSFVLKPLSQLAPNLRHPVLHKTVLQLLEALPEET
ncbi:MAG: 2-amino-4-hydroxy-6-hydroxymethyldihydropteridine diphosphokinase [Roseburia sp.]|nr:2-amino-4-hydroxy-6-hydroxymethyldihydropteridine diphosphokinase [Roseburia sp.]